LPSDLASIGELAGEIPVHFSYNIIELFSGHLYSSPIKAVEELVANSYDAFARKCVVYVPEHTEGSQVWVWDNGDSMDLDGMRELWLVAESRKRDPDREGKAMKRGRLPIGKFGIGKLASYVLGRRITHLCKKNGEFLVVTMDYGRITKGAQNQEVKLSVRRLTKDQVLKAVPFVQGSKFGEFAVDLDGKEESWTLVVIDSLKQPLEIGRLGWVLSTALPLRPDFRLYLNGNEIESSKSKIPKIKEWRIGKDDPIAKKLEYATPADPKQKEPYDFSVMIPGYGPISGTIELYQNVLDTGKAAESGHSNGFFIMVRDRLVNEDDNLFGISSIPLGVGFNRFRAVVYANFLDKYLTANREDISNSAAQEALQVYLRGAWNEVRGAYEKELDRQVKKESIEEHLKNVPGTLLTYPLRQTIEKIIADEYSGFSIRVAPGKKPKANIEKVELQQLEVDAPLATLENGVLYMNVNHPFYQDYADFPGVRKLLVAEVLLEAYLVDAGVESETAREILTRRDQLLRILASRFPEDAVEVSESIRATVASQTEFEIASMDGFRVLGFDSTHIGGKGKPDGIAIAHLGVQKGGVRKYTVGVDSKSSQSEEVQSGNLGLATVARLCYDEYKADFAVVIAPGYQASDGEKSKAVKEARRERICLIVASDFADLVATAATKPLSLDKLRDLFSLRSPVETGQWISEFKKATPASPPIALILQTVWRMQKSDLRDAPQIGAIKYAERKLKGYSNEEIKDWLQSLQRLVPELVVVTGDKVQLNQSPENVLKQCGIALRKLPAAISGASMLQAIREAKK
jgi:hypothetical protein